MGFPDSSDGKESACNAGDLGLIPGLGRSAGGGHGNPLQYSSLENPHGQSSLGGYSPWGHKEWDTTEQLRQSVSGEAPLMLKQNLTEKRGVECCLISIKQSSVLNHAKMHHQINCSRITSNFPLKTFIHSKIHTHTHTQRCHHNPTSIHLQLETI